MQKLKKKYIISDTEDKWKNAWLKNRTYKWHKNDKENYVIDTPPPTVSGAIHMGHIYSYSHTDFIARFRRMKGENVYYPFGFDDNGLPTERLVEKTLNINSRHLSKEEFIQKCYSIIDKEEEKFRHLFQRIGLSVNWDKEYKTINQTSQKLAQMSFLDLLQKNEIYRAEEPVLWDVIDQTALSQADIEDKSRSSVMYDISFQHETLSKVVISTTRPELLPACVALFYHPNDSRYNHLHDSYAISPLFESKIPILPDETVEQDKGTGLVMCCTFGDQADVYWWKTHSLATKIIITTDGKMATYKFDHHNSSNPTQANAIYSQLVGFSIAEARTQMIDILNSHNLVVDTKQVSQVVKCAERSGAELEIITATQWFVKTQKHKKQLIEKAHEIHWHPHFMKNRLLDWIENIQWDWCISRQRKFGISFPIWFSKRQNERGKVILPTIDQLPLDPANSLPHGYSREEIEIDEDVMETWFISSITPQLNSLAITNDLHIDYDNHQSLFPASLRTQSHEIIRSWTFYTILKSLLHENKIPWTNLMISGWCLCEEKNKMSKSKGNIIDPEKLLNLYGADSVRYWAAGSKLGSDIICSNDVIADAKKKINKIWNVARFIEMQIHNNYDISSMQNCNLENTITYDIDLYCIAKLNELIEEATIYFEKYEYSFALRKIENFFFMFFCDQYIEIVKVRAYNEKNPNKAAALSAITTLYYVFQNIIKLFAPVIPYITEELYNSLYDTNSIHLSAWPRKNDMMLNNQQQQSCEKFIAILNHVRKIKTSKQLSMNHRISLLEIVNCDDFSNNLSCDLQDVTCSDKIQFVKKIQEIFDIHKLEQQYELNILFHRT